MNVYKLLSYDSPYDKDDNVTGTVYSVKPQFGAFVAVDNKFQGLINNNELFKELNPGETVNARVIKVKEDGKLDLSIREKAYIQMDTDSEIILDKLRSFEGFLPLNDSTPPEKIKAELNMSKNAFKRAVGRLLKEDKIRFYKNGIEEIKK
jgi:uncharacterized protein